MYLAYTLPRTNVETFTFAKVSRLEAEAKGRTVYLDRLSRERQELMEKLKEASAAQGDAEQKIAGGAAREMEAEGRVGEEAMRLR